VATLRGYPPWLPSVAALRLPVATPRGYSVAVAVATQWLLRGHSVATPWLLRGRSVATLRG